MERSCRIPWDFGHFFKDAFQVLEDLFDYVERGGCLRILWDYFGLDAILKGSCGIPWDFFTLFQGFF